MSKPTGVTAQVSEYINVYDTAEKNTQVKEIIITVVMTTKLQTGTQS